jgi:hypothetical protein
MLKILMFAIFFTLLLIFVHIAEGVSIISPFYIFFGALNGLSSYLFSMIFLKVIDGKIFYLLRINYKNAISYVGYSNLNSILISCFVSLTQTYIANFISVRYVFLVPQNDRMFKKYHQSMFYYALGTCLVYFFARATSCFFRTGGLQLEEKILLEGQTTINKNPIISLYTILNA